jgi:hypothetical protein
LCRLVGVQRSGSGAMIRWRCGARQDASVISNVDAAL